MINPHNVLGLVSNYITELLPSIDLTHACTAPDEDVARNIFEDIESIFNCIQYNFEKEQTLDFTDSFDEEAEEAEVESDDEEDESYTEDANDDEGNNLLHEFSLQYMKKVVDFYDKTNVNTGKRKHSWSSLQNRFKKVKDRNYIRRFRKYIENQGTKKQKLEEIDSFVYESFEKVREQLLFIHDIDLKRWGLQKAREINDESFCGSEHWVHLFKHRHGICSRHVTKLVTKREVESVDEINKSADDFVSDVQKMLPDYDSHYVLNTDQSGLEQEMYSNRTLSFEGEKLTLAKVRSLHNTTHRYTVQPIVSLDGTLVGKLFLCLKEPNGHMSETIKQSLFQADNLIITCSKSGKLTTSLAQYWSDHVLVPLVGDKKCLLLSDYWGGQRTEMLYNKMKHLKRLEIPKKTTSMIQPLDVGWNRQYKHFIREMYNHVRLYDLDFNLAQRNNIIKMNSLAYNQLSSSKFIPMNLHAWYQSEYLKTNPGSFQNVKEVCFSFSEARCCQPNCTNAPFVQCSFCSKVICFFHFYDSYHKH